MEIHKQIWRKETKGKNRQKYRNEKLEVALHETIGRTQGRAGKQDKTGVQ